MKANAAGTRRLPRRGDPHARHPMVEALDAGVRADRAGARACVRRRARRVQFLVAALAIVPIARLIGAQHRASGALHRRLHRCAAQHDVRQPPGADHLHRRAEGGSVCDGGVLARRRDPVQSAAGAGPELPARRAAAPYARVQRPGRPRVQHDDVHRGHQPGVAKHLRAGVRTRRRHDRAEKINIGLAVCCSCSTASICCT